MLSLMRSLSRAFPSRAPSRARPASLRPRLELLEDRTLLSTSVQLFGYDTISSYAGVGFQQNQVAMLYASVNGQPDTTKSDFQAQINWGNGSSTGSLVYEGTSSIDALYAVKGSNVYQQPNSNIPITVTVTGPGGTSTTVQTASAIVAPMPGGLAGTPPPTSTSSADAQNVEVSVYGHPTIASYAGVGFQRNEVGTLYASLNGQPDTTLSHYQAWINWGDSNSWTQGDLVYLSSDGVQAFYMIKGSHIYQQSKSDYPIVVYVAGPDGTSASNYTADASVAPMPSGIPGTPPPTNPLSSAAEDAEVSVYGHPSIATIAGVGFKQQQVGMLYASLNGQPDTTPGDFQAWINWGDSNAWTLGTLVSAGEDGVQAFYSVLGSHTYQQSNSDYPIVVYVAGPDGTSTSGHVADASVSPNPDPITLGPLSPTQWDQNQPGYQGTLTLSGGSGVYQNLQVSGLPTGLSASLLGSEVLISGTPTTSGTFSVQVSVQDSGQGAGGNTYSLTIDPTLTLGPLSPAQWKLNQAGYDGTLAISGGSGSYSGLAVSGLPAGLSASLSGSTITIRGTPGQAGTFDLGISVQDGNHAQASGNDTLSIIQGLALGALSPTQWEENEPQYSGTIIVSGGSGTYSNLQVSGLPQGLTASLQGNNILIGGTPVQQGSFAVAVSIADSAGASASNTYPLSINSPVLLGSLLPAQWQANKAGYQGTSSVSGGSAPYELLSVTGLPPGLSASLSGNTLNISGTPGQSGVFTIQASVMDALGGVGSGTYTLNVSDANTLTISPAALSSGTAGNFYSQSLTATGGSGNYNFSVASGSLPAGLSLSPAGVLSGTPTSAGEYRFSIEVTDTSDPALAGTQSYQLIIAPATTLIANFGGAGLWRCTSDGTSGAWQELTPFQAQIIATGADGTVAAGFGSAGLWRWTPEGGWQEITGANAQNVAVDGSGNVVPGFGGAGLWRLTASGWQELTGANVQNLVADASGDVVAGFGGAGLWRWTPRGIWQEISAANAQSIAEDGNGDVVAGFGPGGVWRLSATWQEISPGNAQQVAVDSGGDVAADFGGAGLWRWTLANGWQEISPGDASSLAQDSNGNITAGFGNWGLWRYAPGSGWQEVSPAGTGTVAAPVAPTYATALLGAGWQQQAMAAAQQMDQLATQWENAAGDAAHQFLGGVADWTNNTLQFLAQKPGVPAQQLGAAITQYFTNNPYDNNLQTYQAAVQAIDEMKQNPAYFWGKNLPNVLMMAAMGSLGGEGAAEAETLAGEVRTTEQVAKEIEEGTQVPTLTTAAAPTMLKQAIQWTAAQQQLVPAAKASYLEALLKQIVQSSGGDWKYYVASGTDGSFIYSGNLGYSVIVDPAAGVWTGGVVGTPSAEVWGAALQPEVVNGEVLLQPNYSLMRPYP